jgi:signal peptidase I
MENKPRKWWVSGLLSLLEPGLGQIYNGQARKGIIILLLPLLLLPGLLLCLNSSKVLFYLSAYALLAIAYYIIVAGDAVSNARKLESEYQVKKYNKIAVYIGVIVLTSVINLSLKGLIRSNYVQAFKIPAGSMVPTLLIGDHILVDRHMAARNPRRGDLIVFEYPEDPSKDFIKRVVAVGGDTVEIKNKVLVVNGKEVQEPYVSHKEADIIPASQNPRDNFGPQVIPDNSFFVLGDNRDRSYDSRFWGAVTKDKVKGTVKNLYWSWDKEKVSVRWDRIGMKVM